MRTGACANGFLFSESECALHADGMLRWTLLIQGEVSCSAEYETSVVGLKLAVTKLQTHRNA
jgi:hypothetical protein